MNKVLIIAEAGVNHNGDINIAKQLIDVAADAGVDYVKFQTFIAKNLVSEDAQKADYQIDNTGKKEESQFIMLKKLELSEADHHELIAYCKLKGVKFLSTAFDLESVDLLTELGIDLFKVPSGEITNKPYLQKLASKQKPIILSTGMANKKEIQDAVDVLKEAGIEKNNIQILHCNTEYPTPMQDVNLLAMLDIKKTFGVEVGYSDHTLGIEVPIAAVALGAVVIEKHFTIDRSLEGPDHRASLEPAELKAMVAGIRNIEKAIDGSGIKEPSVSEKKNKTVARKSIHTAREMNAGEEIQLKDLVCLRPGNGISPMEIDTILGKKVLKKLDAFSLLKKEDVK
jgi:N-acetylneuraminate synthase/N,N'-diacetyllegionaminate synthase